MKRFAILVLVLAGCGKPLYEAGSTGSTGGTPGVAEQEITVSASRHAPDVIFVVDRSGSMADSPDETQSGVCPSAGQHNATCKWDELLSLMTGDASPGEGYVAQLAASLSTATGEPAPMGLVTFSGAAGSASDIATACSPGVVQVALAANATDTIVQDLESIAPSGGTPTAASLAVAGAAFASDPDTSGRDKYVVLLTDGAPNCNGSFSSPSGSNCGEGTPYCVSTGACVQPDGTIEAGAPYGCLDETNTVAAVASLYAQGINTFVIGFGADFSDTTNLATDTLNKMAQAGGEPLANSDSPSFYRASDSADLQNALGSIATALQGDCSFALAQAAPQSFSAVKVAQGSNSVSIPFGGILLSSDRRRIELEKSVCAQIPAASVSVTFTSP